MPRAVVSERQQLRAVAQQVAVAAKDTTVATAEVAEQVEAVSGELPPDLTAQLDDIRARLDAIEP